MNTLKATAISLAIFAASAAVHAKNVKQLVLEQVSPAVTSPAAAPAPAARQDAAIIRLLVEGKDGKLEQRSADKRFYTGERFKVLFKASRDGVVSLYNTPPNGVMNTTPLWTTPVKAGQDVISPNLLLTGDKGQEILHIALEPLNEPRPAAWVVGVFMDFEAKKGKAKDIQLENANDGMFVLAPQGTGLYQQVIIRHR